MKKLTVATLVTVLVWFGLVTPVIGQAPKEKAAVPASNKSGSYARLRQPGMFTYQELVTLGATDTLPDALARKLRTITTTPFLSNEAYYRGARPHRPVLNVTTAGHMEHRAWAATGRDQATARGYRGVSEAG
jgi:hypothetical protein